MRHNTILFVLLMSVSFTAFSQNTNMITHRGAWKNTEAPQNSIASLRAAADQKAWGSEFDIHLTKDNILVVNHDRDFYGIDIATSTYEELLAKKHPNGENIPTAKEYLTEGKKHADLTLIYELKTSSQGEERTLESARKSMELVKELGLFDQTEFIAFSYAACLEFKKLDKDAKVHYLNGDKSPKEIKEAGLSGIDYNQQVFKDNPSWIREAKENGLATNVWTVNEEKDMRYFIKEGVDYITTDEPERLSRILKEGE